MNDNRAAGAVPGTHNEVLINGSPAVPAPLPAALDAHEAHRLSHALRPRHVAMITIGGIIGAGLFVGSSVAINATGPAVIISYILTGLLLLLVMRMLGEMAVEMPQVRSFTEFTRATLGNWAGFSVGWLYWYFWVIGDSGRGDRRRRDHQGLRAVAAVGHRHRAHGVHDLREPDVGPSLRRVRVLVLLHQGRGHHLLHPGGRRPRVRLSLADGADLLNLTAFGGFAPLGWFAVLASVTTVIWSMMGAEVVTIAAAESPEPARAVARMTSTIITRILLFYVLSVFVITCVVPWNKVVPAQSPFTLALEQLRVPHATDLMNAVVLTAVLSCLNSCFYIASRVLFVLATRGDAPHWLVRTNRRHVPARSVLLASRRLRRRDGGDPRPPGSYSCSLMNSSGAIIAIIYLIDRVSQVGLAPGARARGTAALGCCRCGCFRGSAMWGSSR